MENDLPDGTGPDGPTAGDRGYTELSDMNFTLKEGSRGEPWIMVEEELPGLPVLKMSEA